MINALAAGNRDTASFPGAANRHRRAMRYEVKLCGGVAISVLLHALLAAFWILPDPHPSSHNWAGSIWLLTAIPLVLLLFLVGGVLHIYGDTRPWGTGMVFGNVLGLIGMFCLVTVTVGNPLTS